MPMQGRSREGPMQWGGGRLKEGPRKDIDTYTYPVVVSAVDVSGHAKISDLYQQVLTHQAVPVEDRTQHKLSTEPLLCVLLYLIKV